MFDRNCWPKRPCVTPSWRHTEDFNQCFSVCRRWTEREIPANRNFTSVVRHSFGFGVALGSTSIHKLDWRDGLQGRFSVEAYGVSIYLFGNLLRSGVEIQWSRLRFISLSLNRGDSERILTSNTCFIYNKTLWRKTIYGSLLTMSITVMYI